MGTKLKYLQVSEMKADMALGLPWMGVHLEFSTFVTATKQQKPQDF